MQDDSRTLATTVETLEAQVGLVRQFCAANFLQVNVQKCEVIVFDRHRGELTWEVTWRWKVL